MSHLISQLSIIILPLLFAMTLHEAAHAWVADKKGDATARMMGRISLNPWVHVEIFGTILIPLMLFILTNGASIFGWAKPVPVNVRHLRRPRQDMAWVAAAGPGMNLLLALVSGVLYRLILKYDPHLALMDQEGSLAFLFTPILLMLRFSVDINVLLMVFNLIPIPPLDGGRVLAGILPAGPSFYLRRIEPYGMMLLIFFFFIDPFGLMHRVVGPVVSFFSGVIFGEWML